MPSIDGDDHGGSKVFSGKRAFIPMRDRYILKLSWPFASIMLTETSITLGSRFGRRAKWTVPYRNIERAVSDGLSLLIVKSDGTAGRILVSKTIQERVLADLEMKGVPVENVSESTYQEVNAWKRES
jgi:hypothetical protein